MRLLRKTSRLTDASARGDKSGTGFAAARLHMRVGRRFELEFCREAKHRFTTERGRLLILGVRPVAYPFRRRVYLSLLAPARHATVRLVQSLGAVAARYRKSFSNRELSGSSDVCAASSRLDMRRHCKRLRRGIRPVDLITSEDFSQIPTVNDRKPTAKWPLACVTVSLAQAYRQNRESLCQWLCHHHTRL